MSTTVITPNNPQYSTTGPWSAYAGAWAAGSLTYGINYTQSITLNNAAFPNGTLFAWSFPLYGGPFGVWSYPCIVYGSTPELINSAVPSTQVANFVNLSTSYSAALTVNSGQLDTIFDIWLTSQPYGGVSTVKYELEIVPQTDWQYSPLTYTLTDSTLDNAAVYVAPGKIVVVPSSEMLTGTISISDILKSLIWNGVITGQEYISGIEFGPEPGSGSGSLSISSLNYQWNGTQTVEETAGNNTFKITTPGGNDVVGNGGLDTAIYSGLYSQFQIKTSGSETLVTQNNNISTLDYLQDVIFIKFSDGVYNTVTATFTPAIVIQTDTSSFGSTSLAAIGNDYFLYAAGGTTGPELQDNGSAVTSGEFGGWSPIGAVQTASGYDVAWKMAGADEYTVWSTDNNGNYISNLIGAVSGTTAALESFEPIFNQDLNGDGVVGLNPHVIQTDTSSFGSTSLAAIGNDYFLYAAGGTTGPELQDNGSAVTSGEFGGWSPIGAVQTASGYDVAWKMAGADEYTVWSTDNNGNYISNLIGAVSGTTAALESFEPIFNQDLNGDGVVGLNPHVIQTDTSSFGSTSLAAIGNDYFLYAAGGTTGPELQDNGSAVTSGEFGGWSPIGAVQTASGYDVAWKMAGADEYTVWSTDNNGNYISNLIGAVSGTTAALESFEPIFNQDLNGDGVVGLNPHVIQTDTSSFGSTSLAAIGNDYFLYAAGGTTGPELQDNGSAVTSGEFGGWSPIGAVQTASGYDVAWKMAGADEYTVWSTDNNGNYISNLIGAVSGTTAALESFEPIFNQDLNGDGVVGLNPHVIQTDTSSFGSTSLAAIGNDYFLYAAGGTTGPELQDNGSAVTSGEFGGWSPIGAVQTASGYDVAWKMAGADEYTVWSTDNNGNYISNLIGAVSGTTAALESFEPIFNQDLNGDGVVGLNPHVIQTDTSSFGSTSLAAIGNDYFLYAAGGTTGPELQDNGSAVTSGEFGGWSPIGAVQTASGYDVAWKMAGADEYTVWSTDNNGNYISNLIGAVSGTTAALESFEPIFNQDLNGDGVVGLNPHVIQTDTSSFGSTSLAAIGNDYFLYAAGGTTGPELQDNGSAVTSGEFGGWSPIGAVQTASGYDVAWKMAGADEYTVWSTDNNGNYISNLIGAVSGTTAALESFEPIFNQDLNGDGVVGLNPHVIQTDTSSFGSTSLAAIGNDYFLYAAGGTTGPELQDNGSAVTSGEFGGWSPIGAVQTASGYDVAWKMAGADEYTVWSTDNNGNYISNLIGAVSGTTAALESFEPIFNQDLNGDGAIGLYAEPGTTLQISQALSGASGASVIGAGATLKLAAANSASVTFSSSTGILMLISPSTFTGEILNFTGNGSLSGSDQIDLGTISYSSVQDSYADGILTVTDGTNSVALQFNGSYTLANFKFASDGSGGTIVYDPPASSASNLETATIATDTSNDAFIFPSNLGQTINSDHQTAPGNLFGTEAIHFDNVNLGSPTLAGTMHDANESTVVSDVTHDATHVHNALAQLHHAGFLI